LPDGVSGYFLKALGPNFDPAYALLAAGDIPAHTHSGQTISPNQVNCNVMSIATSCNRQYTHPGSKQCSHAHSEHTGIGINDHHARDHNHAGEALSPASVSCNTMSIAVSCNRQYTHPSNQQCVYAGSVAWENCPHFGCVNYLSGDIRFQNDFRITEAEKLGFKKGLAFLNPKGKVLMMLDGKGNLHVAGKVKEGLPRKAKRDIAR